MNHLHIVELELKKQNLSEDDIDKVAFRDFECAGKLNFSIDETQVDAILGDDAFCGGEISEEIFERLEKEVSPKEHLRYFWKDENMAEKFSSYLNEKSIHHKKYPIQEEDWNEKWRENFKRIEISPKLSIVPSWEKKEDNKNNIFIYPGMGFGTGNHETTYLCLSLFEEILPLLQKGDPCLDFGCGSGILGITALKTLKSSVDFVDIDTNALDNCLQNLQLNDFEFYNPNHELVLRKRYSLKKGKFPLVFANILENILKEERQIISDSVSLNGHLIISGLLKGQETNILKEYSSQFKKVKVLTKGEWVALLLQKKAI